MWTLSAVVAIVFLQVVASQQYFPGSCPTPKVLPFTDAQRTTFTSSQWIEATKYKATLENGYDCITWDFHSQGTAGAMTAYVSLRSSYWHSYDWMQDSLTPNTKDVADYVYRCTNMPGTHLPLPGTYKYQLLAYNEDKTTPANSYAVAWSCAASGSGHEEILWILTKSRTYDDTVVQAAIKAVQDPKVGLDVYENALVQTGQNGCTNLDANTTNVFVPPKGESSLDKQELKKLLIERLNNNQ